MSGKSDLFDLIKLLNKFVDKEKTPWANNISKCFVKAFDVGLHEIKIIEMLKMLPG